MEENANNRRVRTGLGVFSLAMGTAEPVTAGWGRARRAQRPAHLRGMLRWIGGARERGRHPRVEFGPALARLAGGPLSP